MAIRWQGRDVGILPELKAEIDRTLAPLPATYVVVSGDRTEAEQDALYFQGRDAFGNVIDASKIVTNTRDSAHEHGAARDFAPLRADGSIDWDPNSAALQRAVQAIRANPQLKSGADFILAGGARDPGHVELRNWRNRIPPIVADATRTSVPVGGGNVSAFGEASFPNVAPPAGDTWFELDPGIVIAGSLVLGAAIVAVATLSSPSHPPRTARARG